MWPPQGNEYIWWTNGLSNTTLYAHRKTKKSDSIGYLQKKNLVSRFPPRGTVAGTKHEEGGTFPDPNIPFGKQLQGEDKSPEDLLLTQLCRLWHWKKNHLHFSFQCTDVASFHRTLLPATYWQPFSSPEEDPSTKDACIVVCTTKGEQSCSGYRMMVREGSTCRFCRGRSLGIDCNEDRLTIYECRPTKLNRDRKKLQLVRLTNCSIFDSFGLMSRHKTAKR